MPRSAATGSMTLLTEHDEATGQEVRSLRLEPAADGKAVLLIEIDERKAGIHREVRYEITLCGIDCGHSRAWRRIAGRTT